MEDYYAKLVTDTYTILSQRNQSTECGRAPSFSMQWFKHYNFTNHNKKATSYIRILTQEEPLAADRRSNNYHSDPRLRMHAFFKTLV